MDTEAFRRHGHDIVDWLADYFRDMEQQAIVPAVTPGDLRRSLPSAAPQSGESFDTILADFRDRIVPGITHWGHPGWFAYFPSNASPPSVLADFLTARDRLGDDAPRMTAYWSSQAHSSIPKAARLAGIASDRCRVIDVDEQFAMRPEALAAAMAEDLSLGLVPGIVVATVGTTSSTACDPLRAIGEQARLHGAWYHLDAAYGGSAAILPELRPLFDGVELADSLVTNPHKWMMTSFDCSVYFVRDVDALLRTFSANPEYLRTRHDGDVVNYRDWGIPLGRRFRALKLWFVLRSYGVTGLQAIIRNHIALGGELAKWVDAAPEWERLAPAPLGLVCLRHVPAALAGNEAALAAHNTALMEKVNASGKAYLTHTSLGGKYVIRVAIGAWRTERRHVEEAWSLLQALSP